MSDYSIKELEKWNMQIEAIAQKAGLDYYEQEFELVSYEDMIAYEAYIGIPSHYPHWSFGKAYDRIRTLNRYNLTGLPYELVINSNPCMAYLMKDNSLLLQILTMAHVYGHNDFFKNNRLFKSGTRAEFTVELFKNHARRVRDYISDPGIGYAKVERILNAAHALRYQCARSSGAHQYVIETDRKRIPFEPEEDLLHFISTYGRLEEWERDIIDIVREETLYFFPQMETKIMNEGWASYWHYSLLHQLDLPQQLYFEFLKRHNQVVKPHEGRLNPYYLGFMVFKDICEKNKDNPKKIFEVRSLERDASFIRRYLTEELCCNLKLYVYEKDGNEYVVSEVADEKGWKRIRDTIAASAGAGSIPLICVTDWMQKDNTLLLEHIYDGRELELVYANETLKHLVDLWGSKVILNTEVDKRKRTVICDEQKKITLINA